METIAEFPGAATAGIDLDALRAGELIDYTGVARAKLDGLRVAYEHFETSASDDRRAEFTRYRKDQGERLLFFSCFEQLRARFAPRPWPEWPAPWRHPTIADLQQFREAEHNGCEFHEFVQWVADRQLAACEEIAHRSGMSVGARLSMWRSAFIPTVLMPGASRRACLRMCPSALPRMNSTRTVRIGVWRRLIRRRLPLVILHRCDS